jgi:hypothetical protein
VCDRPALHSRWMLLLKIEISSILIFIIGINRMKEKFHRKIQNKC